MEAAVFGRHDGPEKSRLPQRAHPRAAGRIDVIMGKRGERGVGPAHELGGEAAMRVVEEWPAERFGKERFIHRSGFIAAHPASPASAKGLVRPPLIATLRWRCGSMSSPSPRGA